MRLTRARTILMQAVLRLHGFLTTRFILVQLSFVNTKSLLRSKNSVSRGPSVHVFTACLFWNTCHHGKTLYSTEIFIQVTLLKIFAL